MIASKKINIIALTLTALVLVGVICVMLIPNYKLTGNRTGIFSYSDLHSVEVTADDYYTSYADGAAKIELDGNIVSKSKNVMTEGSDIKILGGGTYILSGTLENGSVIVDAEDGAVVRLILNGADISSDNSSAIYVKQAKKTVISAVSGTENTLSDGTPVNDEQENAGAAVYSKDDLVINGDGKLNIYGNYADGIKANDTLKIAGANINITSLDHGINANDYIFSIDSAITVSSGGDAVKAKHDDEDKGFLAFENTKLDLTSDGDGASASSAVYANDTEADVVSGGGSDNADTERRGADDFRDFGGFGRGNGRKNKDSNEPNDEAPHDNTSDDEKSTKGIKAGTGISINGGSYNLNCADDALHSDGNLTLDGGIYEISSGDDAVHADLSLTVNPEKINISKCYEGLEGAYITVSGGEIYIAADDDGINAVGEETDVQKGMPHMQDRDGSSTEKTEAEDIWLIINGGHICIEASGDGFDSNGSAEINGGFLEIYGPEDNGNGSIDVGDGGYVLLMNGGELLAAGSSGMAEHPSESSKQMSLAFYLEETYQRESTISLADESGETLISGKSNKKFDWVCISTEKLKDGEKYTLMINDEAAAELTADGIFTSYGSKSKGGFGGDRPEMPNGGERPEMPNGGERPEMPNGGERPEMPNGGERPEMPSGGEPTEMPNGGERPEMPNGGERPEMPNGGERPEMSNGGERPEMSNGGEHHEMQNRGKRPRAENEGLKN